jgi:hydroxymethylglutaryl-CoA lyase
MLPSSSIFTTRARRTLKFVEVCLRDGLQNERKLLTPFQKAQVFHKLVEANVRYVEVGSLVNYARVPQMANTLETIEELDQRDKIRTMLSVLLGSTHLVPKLPSDVDEGVLFVSASETFNKRNIGVNTVEAFQRFQRIQDALVEYDKPMKLRGSISCCWGCPYEGSVSVLQIQRIVEQFLRLNVRTVDLCDTIGVATARTMATVLEPVMKQLENTGVDVGLHLHDASNGQAVINAIIGADMGVSYIQGSIGGLGGCPYSPQRVGNVDSIAVIKALHRAGYNTGVYVDKLEEARNVLMDALNG